MLAYFYFPRDDTELRLVPGDELRLRHRTPAGSGGTTAQPWEGIGHVLQYDVGEEVCLELYVAAGVPTTTTLGFAVEFVWNSTSTDRMLAAVTRLVKDHTAISGYLFHSLLGHPVRSSHVMHLVLWFVPARVAVAC